MREISKNIISIDASSSAIGYAIWKDGKLVYSTSVHVDNPYSKSPRVRVREVEEKFVASLMHASKVFKMETGKKISEVVDTLVLNLGYVQTNGVDESVMGLADVQSYIRHLFYYSGKFNAKYAPVLDISWLDALHKFVGYEGTVDELKVRRTKKFFTVKAAAKIKHGEWLHVGLVSNPHYAVGESDRMSDDEADAIFSGYAYLYLDIKDTTSLNRYEKFARDKTSKVKSKIKAVDKKISTLDRKIKENEEDIKRLQAKIFDTTVASSKTDENSLALRHQRAKQFDSELKELNDEKSELEVELKKIRG